MRTIVAICLGLALSGCATFCIVDCSKRDAARAAADNAKCRELGFKPGTEAYGNCRLQLEQIRATKQAAAAKRREGARRAATLTLQRNNSSVLGAKKKSTVVMNA